VKGPSLPSLSFAALHRRELARDPFSWGVAALLPLSALSWRALSTEVGVMSLFGFAALLLPPAVLALLVPRLARRESWAFWGSLARRPGHAFLGASAGSAVGLLLPIAAGGAAAGAIIGAPLPVTLALLIAISAIVLVFAAVASLAAALTLDASSALALGAVVWGVGVLGYEPLLVALAVSFADRVFEPLLAALILLNPIELVRVALLRVLEVPVFVGPTGVLLERWWGGGVAATLALASSATLLFAAAIGTLAGWRFARRAR